MQQQLYELDLTLVNVFGVVTDDFEEKIKVFNALVLVNLALHTDNVVDQLDLLRHQCLEELAQLSAHGKLERSDYTSDQLC